MPIVGVSWGRGEVAEEEYVDEEQSQTLITGNLLNHIGWGAELWW